LEVWGSSSWWMGANHVVDGDRPPTGWKSDLCQTFRERGARRFSTLFARQRTLRSPHSLDTAVGNQGHVLGAAQSQDAPRQQDAWWKHRAHKSNARLAILRVFVKELVPALEAHGYYVERSRRESERSQKFVKWSERIRFPIEVPCCSVRFPLLLLLSFFNFIFFNQTIPNLGILFLSGNMRRYFILLL